MDKLLKEIKQKRDALAHFEPLPPELTKNLNDWYRIELTYSSNAIEGNTLTRQETAQVVEKNLTVEGKSVQEILEAVNHAAAYDFIKELIERQPKRADITAGNVLDIHKLILRKIDDFNAGRYRSVAVRVAGSEVAFPNPLKVPELMEHFYKWLTGKNNDPIAKIAADAHFKFVSVHPFTDGNGRTGRLLMNLLLMQAGLPPAVITKEDRTRYISSIAKAQTTQDLSDFYRITYEAINASLDMYLQAANSPFEPDNEFIDEPAVGNLLKIGELADKTGEHFATIRYWSQQGLLHVADKTPGGYRLFHPDAIERVREIQRLKNEERLTLSEIKERLNKK